MRIESVNQAMNNNSVQAVQKTKAVEHAATVTKSKETQKSTTVTKPETHKTETVKAQVKPEKVAEQRAKSHEVTAQVAAHITTQVAKTEPANYKATGKVEKNKVQAATKIDTRV